MARKGTNRPPNERSNWAAIDGNTNVRPFSDFGPIGTGNDTPVVQAAVDWSSSTGLPVGGSGIFEIDGLVLKGQCRVICPGVGPAGTTFISPSGASAEAMILLDEGVVADVDFVGIRLDGSLAPPGQHGMYLRSQAIDYGPVHHGGLWYSRFANLFVGYFTGEQIWLHGEGTYQGPIQFIEFESVRAFASATALNRRALRITGQAGQIGFDAGCQFDGQEGGTRRIQGCENILIERSVDYITGLNDSDVAPASVYFRGTTIQGNRRAVTIERAFSILFLGAHFEECDEGIYNSISANTTIVRDCYFANVGGAGGWESTYAYLVGDTVARGGINYRCILAHTNHEPPNLTYWEVPQEGDTFYVAKASGGNDCVMVVDGCEMRYSVPHGPKLFVREFGAQLKLGENHKEAQTVFESKGLTAGAAAIAASINMFSYPHMWITSDGVTALETINSTLPPGKRLSLTANDGDLLLSSAGNIGLGPYRGPVRVPKDGIVTLMRSDLNDDDLWLVESIGGPSNRRSGELVYIGEDDSPYDVPMGTGTIACYLNTGDLTINLPANTEAGPGERITIRRFDGTAHTVTITGVDGGDVELGSSPAFQAIEFEKNALAGDGAWVVVASHGIPVPSPLAKKMYPGGGITFRDHATPVNVLTEWSAQDSEPELRIAIDGDSNNTPNKPVMRDSSGSFSAQVINAVEFNGPVTGDVTGNVTGSVSGQAGSVAGTHQGGGSFALDTANAVDVVIAGVTRRLAIVV